MLERQRREHFGSGPDAHSDSLGSVATAPEARVEVIHGVYAHSFPLVGMTIAQARAELDLNQANPPWFGGVKI